MVAVIIIVSFLVFFLPSITLLAQQPLQQPQQQRPWIGIAGIDMTTEITGALGLKEAKGILVTEVTSASPAHNAGIRGGNVVTNINGVEIVLGGDIILRIDNKTFSTINDLHSYLNTKKVGDTVQLTIARENTVKSISLSIAAMPSSISEASLLQPAITVRSWNLNLNITNILVYPLDPTMAQGYGYQVIGIVVNNSSQPFLNSQVYIVGEFYDKSQRLIGVERAYPELPLGSNRGTSPFEMIFIIPLAKQNQEPGHVVLTAVNE